MVLFAFNPPVQQVDGAPRAGGHPRIVRHDNQGPAPLVQLFEDA
jgi:hypothetical protein